MHGILSEWKDTIAAIATPPGLGAIGVLRLSGDQAYPIIQQLFPSKNLSRQNANTLHVGYLKEGEELLDEVVLSLFKAPHSYTGEDVIEISCHGSAFVQQEVLNKLSKEILAGNVNDGDRITLDYFDESGLVFRPVE